MGLPSMGYLGIYNILRSSMIHCPGPTRSARISGVTPWGKPVEFIAGMTLSTGVICRWNPHESRAIAVVWPAVKGIL